MGTAERVAPLLNAVDHDALPVAMDADVFADADVLRPAPSQPQRPVQRVLAAIETADRLRALAPVVLPAYVDAVHEAVLAGATCELVLDSGALDGLLETYDDRFEDAAETGRLDVAVHDAVPFGLLLTDAEVCVVAYDEEGVLRAAVAGEGDRLREWATDCYEHYRGGAEVLSAPTGREP